MIQNEKGRAKYRTYLHTFNGRDTVRDLFEELADIVNYAEALSQEHEHMRAALKDLIVGVPSARNYLRVMYGTDFLAWIEETNASPVGVLRPTGESFSQPTTE